MLKSKDLNRKLIKHFPNLYKKYYDEGSPILAKSQDHFKRWRNKANPGSTREAQGRIIYQRMWVLDDPDFPEYARQEIQLSTYEP